MLHQQVIPAHSLELLREISPLLSKYGFYLAGGTALALRFGHRISVDLDFFSSVEFDPDAMVDLLAEEGGEVPLVLQKTKGSVCFMLRETKIELLRYDYPLLEAIEEKDGLFLCSLADNSAMKLSALTARGSKKDFVDVAALLKEASLEKMLRWFEEKYPNVEAFMVMKSLTWFDDAEQEPDPVFLQGESWGEVKKTILSAF